MHLNAITIPIEIELTAKSRVLLDALMQSLKGAQPAEPNVVLQPPRIAQHWPEQGGIYSGIARGFDDDPDGHLVLLPDEPTGKLNWTDAKAWAESLGNGARLPTRFESALLYANLRDQFDTSEIYWIGTQYSDYSAFGQNFDDGDQYYYLKKSEARARAVRRLVL